MDYSILTTYPAVYVACLASYKNDVIHGTWITRLHTKDVDIVREEIAEMLALSPIENAVEWAIHNSEGFRGLQIEKHENLNDLSDLAGAVDEYGDAYVAYVENIGRMDATLTDFKGSYVGHFDHVRGYAHDLVADGLYGDVPGSIRQYLDYGSIANDLIRGGSIWVTDEDGPCHVFHNV